MLEGRFLEVLGLLVIRHEAVLRNEGQGVFGFVIVAEFGCKKGTEGSWEKCGTGFPSQEMSLTGIGALTLETKCRQLRSQLFVTLERAGQNVCLELQHEEIARQLVSQAVRLGGKEADPQVQRVRWANCGRTRAS